MSCLQIIGFLDNVPAMMQHTTHTEIAQTTKNQWIPHFGRVDCRWALFGTVTKTLPTTAI